MAAYETREYDVLIIGAGGAGLRAAIEASASGVRVGLVCKSLLGKAHTVMAEGGMAAALANVDERDGWQVHFADTMRGGQYLNQWRMAEIHAKEAPARVNELEAWGALFDRTNDGRILQRNFGGHAYPRLAHVGDRTGLEMIRTLQDHGVHQGMTVHMEITVTKLFKDGDRVAGAFGYDRERGRFRVFKAPAVILATGGLGKAYKITSNSWECTGDGIALAYHAGAQLKDMEFVQFHPTGMVWPPSVSGILVTEGVRGEGGVLTNSEGKRFMFDNIPELYKELVADDAEEGWRYVTGDREARRPPELLTRDHVARMILAEVKAGRGTPHGGAFLDIAWIKERVPGGAEHIKRKLPSMYHQFKQLADLDITEEPMEVGPTTHYAMGGVKVDSDSQMTSVPGSVRGGRVRDRAPRGQPPGRQLAVGLGGLRQSGPASTPRSSPGTTRARRRSRRRRGSGRGGSAGAVRPGRHRRGPLPASAGAAGADAGECGHHPRRARPGPWDRGAGGPSAARAPGQGARQPGVELGLAHGAGPGAAAHRLRGDRAGGEGAAREPGRPHSRRPRIKEKDLEWGKVNLVVEKGADGSMQVRKEPVEPVPERLAKIIEEQG